MARARWVWWLAGLSLMAPLASLAGPPPTAGSASPACAGSAPLPWLPAEGAASKSGCFVSLTCANGTLVACNGLTSCVQGPGYVSCDGVRYDCPSFCSIERECCDGSSVSCEGHTSCTLSARGVRCDGVTYNCPRCPILP